MITLLAVLLGGEALGTVVFVVVLLMVGGWRSTRVGRHLMFYGVALSAIYLGTFVRVLWRTPLSLALLVALHAAFALACWHRVFLVLKERREDPED